MRGAEAVFAWWQQSGTEMLVVCPACGARAAVAAHGATRELACDGCALRRIAEGSQDARGVKCGRDPDFKCDFWLPTVCCCRTLWALNGAHLAAIVAAVRGEAGDSAAAELEPAVSEAVEEAIVRLSARLGTPHASR